MKFNHLLKTAAVALTSLFSSHTVNSCDITDMLSSHPHWGKFIDYQEQFNKQYSVTEIEDKFINFIDNYNKIIENDQFSINQFMDLSEEQFKEEVHLGCFLSEQDYHQSIFGCDSFEDNDDAIIPDSIDWRTLGAVTPVKNQGSCGSCWTFSATGAMEGAFQINTGELVSLSEQQFVDCVDHGCFGGLMDDAFEYAEKNNLCSEDDLPYTAKSGTCDDSSSSSEDVCDSGLILSSCVDIPSGNETALKVAVSRGPVSVAIEADTSVFQLYSNGIITSDSCGTNLDHGVLVVGYGEEDGNLYWLVKNSWGSTWGDEGYVRIGRTDDPTVLGDGVCGIAMQASYPVV
mgnify:CR=1 FL=1|tara:strand:+ start:318 stop:1352 length:1035 start_codon:yes stop_codon:yes gene_type:complete